MHFSFVCFQVLVFRLKIGKNGISWLLTASGLSLILWASTVEWDIRRITVIYFFVAFKTNLNSTSYGFYGYWETKTHNNWRQKAIFLDIFKHYLVIKNALESFCNIISKTFLMRNIVNFFVLYQNKVLENSYMTRFFRNIIYLKTSIILY